MTLTACSTLPTAAPHGFVPIPAPVTPLTVCWIDTGGVTVPGGYGAGGSTEAATWEVTAAALVIRHPKGDLVLDTGLSPTAQEDAATLTGWRRFAFDQTAGRNQLRRSLKDSLAALGVTKPLAFLLSHAHADHAGGATTMPEVPVWLAAEELALVSKANGVVLPAHAKTLEGRMVPLVFAEQPWANFDSSFDVFGDGSVVVVPTFGHTPGSVATFINVSPTKRFVHVGDLINLEESLTRNVGKSWLMKKLTDEDEGATDLAVARLVQLHAADPALVVLPAHDRRVFVREFGEGTESVPPCIGSAP
jgi:glyoxylase-like metal-dependent hydrolase (beta-lactamase superfamily II)